MCMLSYFPAGIMPVESHLKNGALSNPDGHGYAIVTSTGIIVERSLYSYGLITKFMKEREAYPDGPALFHSRISTGGLTSVGNCHPFRAGEDDETVIAHNGILFGTPKNE